MKIRFELFQFRGSNFPPAFFSLQLAVPPRTAHLRRVIPGGPASGPGKGENLNSKPGLRGARAPANGLELRNFIDFQFPIMYNFFLFYVFILRVKKQNETRRGWGRVIFPVSARRRQVRYGLECAVRNERERERGRISAPPSRRRR